MRGYRSLVALDIDGCLANFTKGFLTLAQSMGKIEEVYDSKDQTTWEFGFHVDPVWDAVTASHVFWENLEPLIDQDDVSALHALATECEIIYVTGRRENGTTADQTKRWLMSCDLPQGALFLSEHKLEVLMPAAHQLIGVLEDRPLLLETMAAAQLPVVARSWLYNANVQVPHVNSVAAFVDRLGVQATTRVGFNMPLWPDELDEQEETPE